MTRPVGRPTSPRGCCRRSPSAETAQAPGVHRCSRGRSDLLTPLWVAERPLVGEQPGDPPTGSAGPSCPRARVGGCGNHTDASAPLDTVVATRGTEAFGGAPNDGSLHHIEVPSQAAGDSGGAFAFDGWRGSVGGTSARLPVPS